MNSRSNRGFTLIELLAVISIMGVLIAIGVPSFRTFVAGRAVTGHVSEIASAMRLARAEAIKRGAPVTLCRTTEPDSDEPSCSSGDWTTGWVIFVDRGTQGQFNAETDQVVQVHGPVTNSGGITRSGSASITFLPSGVATGAAGSFTFLPTLPEGDANFARLRRVVCVNFVGSTRMSTTGTCS
ncbi:GspH/FimT family pseudopilin [Caldimonas thermodepolymerans]|jgi:prepilin-type N-terminal cleavage/methylation domain|uniref:GspH/FimT family pseudopilin n=1 Tax=Caldimonas thermodepolymerans TaxID=215580 RepID=UPI002490FBE1|nr:GspH/FimT family pseudopilin [Caldimonas thermodepolymerans]